MSPHKIGRPKVEHPKNIDVKCRFDEISHNKLMEYCEKHGITRTTAIRKAVDLLINSDK